MSWQILVLISSFFAAVATILTRKVLQDKKLEPIAFATLFQFVCALILGVIGIFAGQMKIDNIVPLIPYLLFSGVLYGVGSIFLFKALRLEEASKFTVIFSTQALFTIFGAMFFLGESLDLGNWIGVILMMVSVGLISFTPDSIDFDKDELFALMAAACFGIARVSDKFIIDKMDFFMFLFLGFLIPGIIMLILSPGTIKQLKQYTKPLNLGKLFLVSVIYIVNSIAFFLALSIGKSSQVVTAAITGVIFTEVLGVFLLGERKNIPRKIMGSILTIIGLLLIIR